MRLIQPINDPFPEARFVGSIYSDNNVSMGCLLNDGTILTPLHTIYDYQTNTYDDIQQMEVFFVYGNKVFAYQIDNIMHDGTSVLKQYGILASTFDYARLTLVGDPCRDLRGGLDLDTVDHAAKPYNTDPLHTVAVSGPIFRKAVMSDDFIASRVVSHSANQAAFAGNYAFHQMGTHTTQPGFSGQAVFPNSQDAKSLYAIHCGRNKFDNVGFGFKVSEYLKAVRRQSVSKPRPLSAGLIGQGVFMSRIVKNEHLRRSGHDAQDILAFLQTMSTKLGLARNQKKIKQEHMMTVDDVPTSLQYTDKRFVDSHQVQHLKKTGRGKKSLFNGLIAKSPESFVINALANAVNKIISHHYKKFMKTNDSVLNKALLKSTLFIVDVGFDIGDGTTLIALDGFSGDIYHIYPISRNSIKKPDNTVIIGAQQMLQDNLAVRPR